MTAAFYTGSYGHTGEASIVAYQADFSAQTLERTMVSTVAECPSYLLRHPNGKVLYAVRELTEEGALYVFSITEQGLELRATLLTGGMDPCHLSLDEEGRFLFVTNYSGSCFAVFRLGADGLSVERTDLVRHTGSGPNPDRQSCAHPHCAVCVKGAFYVCDLGCDKVFRYELDRTTGTVREQGGFPLPPGSGPRHLLPSPVDPDLVYVVGELAGKVFVFRLMGDTARLIQSISVLPEGFDGYNISAALKLSHDKGALFVSNRGHDSIAVLRILPVGTLELMSHCPSGGKTPRDFSVFGDYLVVANQDSDLLCVLHYDANTFTLSPTGLSEAVTRPTMVMAL